MPSLEEVGERVKFLLSKGDKARKCHFGLVDVEARERAANPKQRTRLVRDLHTPQAYSEWNAQFDRYVTLVTDPNIAYKIMVDVLAFVTDETIQGMAEGTKPLEVIKQYVENQKKV